MLKTSRLLFPSSMRDTFRQMLSPSYIFNKIRSQISHYVSASAQMHHLRQTRTDLVMVLYFPHDESKYRLAFLPKGYLEQKHDYITY